MPGPPFVYTWQDHADHGRHNEEFADLVIKTMLPKKPEYADWALVAIAYAALHYTKAAILRDTGLTSEKHVDYTDRANQFREGNETLVRQHLPTIAAKYKMVFQGGHEARYRGFFKKGGTAALEVARQRILLDEIKQACGF
jgi:hypothetical protein